MDLSKSSSMDEVEWGKGPNRKEQRLASFHAEDRGKRLLGVVKGAIAIIEDANAVPELRILLGERKRVRRGLRERGGN